MFTFYITLCMNIVIQLYAWLQYARSTDLLSQIYLDGNVAGVTGTNYFPGYIYMVECS